MDTLTHTVLGACLGELIAGKRIGKKAMIIGAIVNNIPDIDVVCYLWMDPSEALLAHRGITHSLLFNGLLTLFLAGGLQKIFNGWRMNYGHWLLLIGSGVFSHLFLDMFNAYGTGLFEPYNKTRFSLNSLFILDPFFTLPMVIATFVLLFIGLKNHNRKVWPATALVLSSLYLALCGVNKIYVDHKTKQSMSLYGISSDHYFVTPTPLNNLLWFIVVQDKADFYSGYYSVLDTSLPTLRKVYRNDTLLAPYKGLKSVQNLLRFSQGYYCVEERDGAVLFNDMRFGQEDGWLDVKAPFVFSFDITQERPGMLRVQKERFKTLRKESLALLYTRIRGEQ